MVNLRCTGKLQKRSRVKLKAEQATSSGKLGDWTCHLVYLGQTQTILCVNHTTRLPIFLTAANGKQFPDRLQHALRIILTHFAVPQSAIYRECSELDTVILAKTNDRSVLGSLNDFAQMADYYDVAADEHQLLQLSLHLAQTPCKPIDYQSPDRCVKQLLAPASASSK